MLKSMRDVRFIKIIIWITAIGFVGLIVLDWGADIGGRGGSANVGEINGRVVSYQEFDAFIKQAYQQKREQLGREPDFAGLVQETWDRLVVETLMAEEVQKRGIVVSSSEVDYFNRTQPLEAIKGHEGFQTEGEFDPAKYNQFLDNPATYDDPQALQFIQAVEGTIERFLLTQKLQERVGLAVKVTDAEARESYLEENEQVKVEYAAISAGSIPDSTATVTDAEVSDYYGGHQEDFEQDSAVRFDFLVFDKQPSAEDEKGIEAEIRGLLEQVRGGGDFGQLALENSDDSGSASKRGDLGYFGRGKMVPAFERVAFSLEKGEVSEPVRTPFGWHLIQVEDRKTEDGQEQVKARHILRNIEKSPQAIDRVRESAELFQAQARKRGFSVVAAGLKVQDTGFISSGEFVPGLGNRTTGLVSNFLKKPEGEISALFENDQGIFIYSLKEKREAGTRPMEEVLEEVKGAIRKEKKLAIAKRSMEKVAAGVGAGRPLIDAAKAHGAISGTTEWINRLSFVPQVGSRNEFFGAAFGLDLPGKISDVVTGDRGVYLVKLIERKPADEKEFESEKNSIRAKIARKKRTQAFASWFNDLKEKAEIVDNRHRFFSKY